MRLGKNKMEDEDKHNIGRQRYIVFGDVSTTCYIDGADCVSYELTKKFGYDRDEDEVDRIGYGFKRCNSYDKDGVDAQEAYMVGKVFRNAGVGGRVYTFTGQEIRAGFSEEGILEYLVKRVTDERAVSIQKAIENAVSTKVLIGDKK